MMATFLHLLQRVAFAFPDGRAFIAARAAMKAVMTGSVSGTRSWVPRCPIHPLTAPAVSPSMKYRWNITNRIRIGNIASTDPAMSTS